MEPPHTYNFPVKAPGTSKSYPRRAIHGYSPISDSFPPTIYHSDKGPSINDVAFKGGRGVAKKGFWGDFQGLTEAPGGGRGVKIREN